MFEFKFAHFYQLIGQRKLQWDFLNRLEMKLQFCDVVYGERNKIFLSRSNKRNKGNLIIKHNIKKMGRKFIQSTQNILFD